MNEYVFDGVDYKVYSLVNQGTIAKAMQVAKEHGAGFFRFLHDTIGLCNYTHSATNRALWFTIRQTESGYSMEMKWAATKMKGEGLVHFRNQAIAGHSPLPIEGKWRDVICSNIYDLHSYCHKFEIDLQPLNVKDYPVRMWAEVAYENLISPPADEAPEDFENETSTFKTPIELLSGIIDENISAAIEVFGKDHDRLTEILHPFEGKLFAADFLIGASLYLFEKRPVHAYAYFRRANENIHQINSPYALKQMFDYMGNIEHLHLNNTAAAEQHFIRAMVLGNQQSFLKLAYSYLLNPTTYNRASALKLAQVAEAFLPLDEDEIHRLAGYHIAASVYVWNNYYDEAAAAQSHFLSNEAWCIKYKEHVESYLLLCLAKNNVDFISNLITDYPVLQKHFNYLLETWHYGILHPKKDGFQMYMIPLMNRINAAKTLYY